MIFGPGPRPRLGFNSKSRDVGKNVREKPFLHRAEAKKPAATPLTFSTPRTALNVLTDDRRHPPAHRTKRPRFSTFEPLSRASPPATARPLRP